MNLILGAIFTRPMRRADIESIIFFLRRTMPRGEAETDELCRVVAVLETELAKRKKPQPVETL